MTDSINKKILIEPNTDYLSSESSVDENRFVWKYHIQITNNSKEPIQLLNRHWKIYNDNTLIDEVFGPGVVGLQPLILSKKSLIMKSFVF